MKHNRGLSSKLNNDAPYAQDIVINVKIELEIVLADANLIELSAPLASQV